MYTPTVIVLTIHAAFTQPMQIVLQRIPHYLRSTQETCCRCAEVVVLVQ